MDPLSLLHQVLGWIVPTRWSALTLVVIAVLPFVLSALAFWAADRVSAREFFHVPIVYGLAALTGVCAGLALIHVRDETGRDATLASILRAGSRWDVSANDFLAEIANPFTYQPMRVVDEFLMPGGRSDALHIIVIVGLISLGAVILLSILFWRPVKALRALAAAAIVALWAMLLAVYLITLAYWSLAQLNFWAIAIMLFIIQYYRTHPHRT